MSATVQPKGNKLYIVVDLKDENNKRKQKWIPTGLSRYGNQRRAEEMRKEIEREYDLKKGLVPTNITLDEFVKVWLEDKKKEIDIITYRGYENLADAQIIPYFEKKKIRLTDVTYQDLQKYIDEKSKKGNLRTGAGLSPKTLKSHLNIFRLVFKEAKKRKFIFEDPCEFVKLPKSQKKEMNFYNAEELNTLFEAIKDERLFLLIFVILHFGLRRSEALGLRWDAVDFKNNKLTIKHTVVTYGNKVEKKDSTKTDSSYRVYPLSEEMKMVFQILKEQEERERAICKGDYIENDYIFKWPDGHLYDPDWVSKKFKDYLIENNLPVIRLHDLRHSCASLLLANDFQMYDVKEWLGHSGIQITIDIYGHLDTKRKNKAQESIQNSVNVRSFLPDSTGNMAV